MSLPAVCPSTRDEDYEPCDPCGGEGSFMVTDGDAHERQTCEECEGSGVFYLGPIYEPEHYLEI